MSRFAVLVSIAAASQDTCSVYEVAAGSCGQSDLDCDYVKYAKKAQKGLVDGTCASQGYTVVTGTTTKKFPIIGDIVISTYDQPGQNAETCSVYEVADGSCGQSDLDCRYVSYAKAAQKGLVDGTCASQGYTVQTGTQTKKFPIIGNIVISTYDQPGKNAETCSVYEVADGSCGQSDLDCDYVKYAKAAQKGLADGTCASQGYTVVTGTTTKKFPVIGDIVISTYDQPGQNAETCSVYEVADGSCGQSDLDCRYVSYAKAAQKGLVDGTCASQGYTVQTGTQTKKFPIIGNIIISTYDKAALAVQETCSVYSVADGSCGQSDLPCEYVKYAKKAQKGLVDGTCASQGYTVQTGTQTKKFPFIGDIVISTYDKASFTV